MIGYPIQAQDIKDDTDIAIAQNGAAANTGIFYVKVAKERRKRLDNHLLFSK